MKCPPDVAAVSLMMRSYKRRMAGLMAVFYASFVEEIRNG